MIKSSLTEDEPEVAHKANQQMQHGDSPTLEALDVHSKHRGKKIILPREKDYSNKSSVWCTESQHQDLLARRLRSYSSVSDRFKFFPLLMVWIAACWKILRPQKRRYLISTQLTWRGICNALQHYTAANYRSQSGHWSGLFLESHGQCDEEVRCDDDNHVAAHFRHWSMGNERRRAWLIEDLDRRWLCYF